MLLATLIGKLAAGPLARALPAMSDTERAALEAGTVGFEGSLFAGRPAFKRLNALGAPKLSTAEQSFLDNEVRALCAKLDDYAIDNARDLPPEVWAYMKERKFFGMIVPREFGGLGFSATAQAAVVTRIATVNVAAAVTVMVPNSIGPAELLAHYGTPEQKHYWLPRLANGTDIPCFGLTNPYAGSDAASIPDRGVLAERDVNGVRTRGFLVTFDKRYITLAPVATVVGLAFRAIDPSKPEAEQDLGITCALLPVPLDGVDIGRRHRPMDAAFMNGPIRGRDIFVPMDWVIGGEKFVGQGWRMLMESLAAGRAISLPALGAAMQQLSLFVANGYGKLREQFGLPVGKFHAISALIAETAAELYATDAARRLTAAELDAGERPSVASAILKLHLTEAGRRAVSRGMDILGGKAIQNGPANLLSNCYKQAPIAITVEGANILTRSLIIFGQGAVRCHPYVLEEIQAVAARDHTRLGRALLGHIAHVIRNFWSSLVGVPMAMDAPEGLRKEARLLTRLASKFAFTCDLAMGLLGGKLKRLELLSQRLGDVLSHLYLASAACWRYGYEADPQMLPIARAAVRMQLRAATVTLRDLFDNMPFGARRIFGWVMLRGVWQLNPVRDRQWLAIAELLRTDGKVMARLAQDVSVPKCGGLADLQHALALYGQLGADTVSQLNKTLRKTGSIDAAARSAASPTAALNYLRAADKVIQVDDFAPAAQADAGAAQRGASRRFEPAANADVAHVK
jgi:acyl-CoA dehydrogenase